MSKAKKVVLEICSVDGCGKTVHSKRLCNTHYRRFLKHGSPLKTIVSAPYKGEKCSVEGCDNPASRRGLCNMHRQRKKRFGSFDLPEPKTCSVEGCGRSIERGGLGMCSKHYQRFKRNGNTNEPPKKKTVCKKCGKIDKLIRRNMCRSCYDRYMTENVDSYKTSKKLSKYKRRTAEKNKCEPFTTEEILDKTSGLCSLCFEEINLSLPQSHPLGLNIDHIQPLSKGGSNMKYNLLAAHRACNELKGNRWKHHSNK